MALLVYNIEPASPSMISSLDRHCVKRIPDGSSNIDPARTHLNRIIVGSKDGLSASLKKFFDGGVKRPAAQSERPYLRIVASASPEYFRPKNPEAVGTWNQGQLDAWLEATMEQLEGEHGEDLIFAHLHLDEDTPHVHAVVIPTYTKKPRRPGKRKRGETAEAFEARKQAAVKAKGVRAAGRASHPTLSKPDSFLQLRKRMALAVDHLGIEYGEDRQIDAAPGTSTRQWVKNKASELRKKEAELKRQKDTQEAREKDLHQREKELEAAQTARLLALVKEKGEAEAAADEARQKQADAEAERDLILNDLEATRDAEKAAQEAVRSTLDKRDAAKRELEDAVKARDQSLSEQIEAQTAKDRALANASEIADNAKEAAEKVLDAAETEANRIVTKEVQKRIKGDRILRSFQVFTDLLREGIKTIFGQSGYDRFKDWVDPRWNEHPDNPERPVKAQRPTYGGGPSGP